MGGPVRGNSEGKVVTSLQHTVPSNGVEARDEIIHHLKDSRSMHVLNVLLHCGRTFEVYRREFAN
jgi:hypothetical protein